MEKNKMFYIEVAYASPNQQKILTVLMKEGDTIEAAIKKSGILNLFPQIDLKTQSVGIFSKRKKLTDMVKEGDRIEIYRALLIDPKEARRSKAKKR
jgi:putative ubiquitin-RnfH superfamily antitoxin RatB of RatAB toxin-antitoxin module